MKRVLLIVALAIVSIATTSAQYASTYEVQTLPELSTIADTTSSPFTHVLSVLIIFYSLVVVVLTFKLFGLCENVKELTKDVKNLADYISSTNRQ